MATIIKQGAIVHAHYRAEAGNIIGNPCRFKGTAIVVGRDSITFNSDDERVLTFKREVVHHANDCPRAKGK